MRAVTTPTNKHTRYQVPGTQDAFFGVNPRKIETEVASFHIIMEKHPHGMQGVWRDGSDTQLCVQPPHPHGMQGVWRDGSDTQLCVQPPSIRTTSTTGMMKRLLTCPGHKTNLAENAYQPDTKIKKRHFDGPEKGQKVT